MRSKEIDEEERGGERRSKDSKRKKRDTSLADISNNKYIYAVVVFYSWSNSIIANGPLAVPVQRSQRRVQMPLAATLVAR